MGTTALALAAIVAAIGSGHVSQRGYDRQSQSQSQASMGEDAIGRASVIDGDTIEIEGRRIRLFGIDAPESSQSCEDASGAAYPCGRRSAMALDQLIAGRTVTCVRRDEDRYGRLVGVCSSNGVDLNGWMVRNGHAIAYTRYGADYAGAEAMARRERTNMWQGRFEEPSQYRREHSGDRGYRRPGDF